MTCSAIHCFLLVASAHLFAMAPEDHDALRLIKMNKTKLIPKLINKEIPMSVVFVKNRVIPVTIPSIIHIHNVVFQTDEGFECN